MFTPASSAPAAYASAKAPHRLFLRGWPRMSRTLSDAERWRLAADATRGMVRVDSVMKRGNIAQMRIGKRSPWVSTSDEPRLIQGRDAFAVVLRGNSKIGRASCRERG